MEYWASILILTFGSSRTAELSVLRAGRTYTPRKILLFISVGGWVDHGATECGLNERVTWIFSKDPTGNGSLDFPWLSASTNCATGSS